MVVHLDKSKGQKKEIKKKTAFGCRINPWQSTIYQHQLKQHYKLPKPQ